MNTPTSETESQMSLDCGQYDSTKDVAVVGIACRVPGGNNNPTKLWQSLLERKDASGEVPAMRWEPYLRRDPRNPKIMSQLSSRGYFLDNLEDFDSQFFGISPKEAEQMDPQQRISLEVTWEALENAGIPAKSLSGSDTAVFWGVSNDDYAKLVLEDMPNIEPWMGIGTAFCGTPNRISYHLNLMGPSSSIDAACASSLVAVHHGVQSIVNGESKLAIVGGGNVLCGPALFCVLERAGALSSEGCCRSFDNEARGFGRGEGAAAIVLKNIAHAIQDGDHILGVIKGTAVAQDGKTNGIMAPNGMAQQLVARKALGVAGVDPLTVRYVEAHATSTPLGDFTEISALAGVYGTGRRADDPCFVGSIKPNIGHLEAGAGAIGLIKAIMTLQNRVMPPQANLATLNKRIDWETSGLRVVQEQTEWPKTDEICRAAVCSYGYGGTVSHAVLEQYVESRPSPLLLNETSLWEESKPSVLLISAPEKKRIPAQARALREWMNSDGRQCDLHSIESTLAVRRDHHNYRAAMVVDNHEDASQLLEMLAGGLDNSWITHSQASSNENQGLVWVFSGHGAHWPNMGKEMLGNKFFFEAIQPLDEIVYSEIAISPIGLLESGQFESSDQLQILTFMVQIGISAVLQSYGIFPEAIIGHSTGEIAASVIAGALTPEEGTIVVTRRSVLYRRLSGQGKMILVNRPFGDVFKQLTSSENLTAAIDCSPSSCVVAGPGDAVAKASEEFKNRGVKVFDVRTDIAFHSPMMNELKDPLMSALSGAINPTIPTRARLYSTSLQDPRGQDLRDALYWANNMMNPVHFTSAVQAAAEDSYRIFMEVSSHPLVCHSIDETLADQDIDEHCVVSTLVRNKPAEKSILLAISQLHCYGVPVDWSLTVSKSWAEGLPNTSWAHRPIWRKVETSPFNAVQTHDVEQHTLLGQRTEVAGAGTVMYSTRLDSGSKPYPQSHPVQGTEIIPAAVYIMTLLKATGGNLLRDIALIVPVAVDTPRSIQVVAQRDDVKVLSRLIHDNADEDDSPWVTHATSQWGIQTMVPESSMDIPATIARIGDKLDKNFSVDYLAKVGVTAMGFPWAITEHYGNTTEMLARVDINPNITLKEALPWDPSSWAPILDAATSVGSTIFFDDPKPRMVGQIKQVDLFTKSNPPKLGWLHVKPSLDKAPSSDVTVLDDDGAILAKFTGMHFAEIESSSDHNRSMDSLVHQVTWQPAMPSEEPLPVKQIVLVTDDATMGEKWLETIPPKIKIILASSADHLQSMNATCSLAKETAIVYLPSGPQSQQDIVKVSENTTWQLLELMKFVIRNDLPLKVFVLTHNIGEGETPTALAQAPLVGLSRILASEHSEQFGGLIDTEVVEFPLTSIRYIQGADIIRIRDGVPRVARLRGLPRHKLLSAAQGPKFFTRKDGTYLITGGLGGLGLEVAEFLVDQGARRIVLVSRRSLPPRRMWDQQTKFAAVINKIKTLESRGASVYTLALDVSVPSAAGQLLEALDQLSLPPVRGVVHAAGVLENQLALETSKDAFARVLAPKVTGGLVLHDAFPPRSVDFFVLFSSCGQLVGSTGQSSYASANAFLDTLATYRRAHGDYALAFQWTAWREVGMAAGSDFVQAEFKSKGVTDIGRDEAFEAWMHAVKYDVDHCVVLRGLPVEEGKDVPSPILKDIAPRYVNSASAKLRDTSSTQDQDIPRSGEALKMHLEKKIQECVAQVLHMIPDEVDKKAVLSDLGLDSVMTVYLRRQLHSALDIQVPPTLTWSHPTINHLVTWFVTKMEKN